MCQSRDSTFSRAGLAHLHAAVEGNIESHDQLTNLASKTASRRLLIVLEEIAQQRRRFAEQLRQMMNGDNARTADSEKIPPVPVDLPELDDQLFAGEIAFALLGDLEASEQQLLDCYAAAMKEARHLRARELLAEHRQQVAAALTLLRAIRRQRW